MKKLLFIIIILFINCSKDTTLAVEIIDPIDLSCNCVLQTYQVPRNGAHILQGQSNVRILCLDDGKEFDKVYTTDGTRLLMYKKYKCN